MRDFLTRRRAETGASAVEYGLLVAFIAAIIIGTVTVLGLSLPALYTLTF